MTAWLGRDYRTGNPIRVGVEHGTIATIEPLDESPDVPVDEFLCPGLIDIQVNGYGGVNFGDPCLNGDQIRSVAIKLISEGVTRFLPTITTDAFERMEQAFRNLALAANEGGSNRLVACPTGFHLEGPFISSEDGPRGAHPLEHCRSPDWELFERLQKAAAGRICLVTLAPELPGAVEFIRRAVANDVRIAIGHTAANREQILAAIDAGATLATHLGNAAHDRLQRHHNYVYDQLGDDRLLASLILDGHHLPPHLAKIFVRAKGTKRVVLISDAVQHAGLPPGIYEGFGQQVVVRADGFVGLVGQPRLAGSGLLLRQGVANMMRFAGSLFSEAIDAATGNPAKFLGWHRIGKLEIGCVADLLRCRFDLETMSIKSIETMIGGS